MSFECAQFLAVCSSSILAEALYRSSLFAGQSREKRRVSERHISLLIGSLQPSTSSDKLSDHLYSESPCHAYSPCNTNSFECLCTLLQSTQQGTGRPLQVAQLNVGLGIRLSPGYSLENSPTIFIRGGEPWLMGYCWRTPINGISIT